jgi:hypothetical protein
MKNLNNYVSSCSMVSSSFPTVSDRFFPWKFQGE